MAICRWNARGEIDTGTRLSISTSPPLARIPHVDGIARGLLQFVRILAADRGLNHIFHVSYCQTIARSLVAFIWKSRYEAGCGLEPAVTPSERGRFDLLADAIQVGSNTFTPGTAMPVAISVESGLASTRCWYAEGVLPSISSSNGPR
jgi:hypothetical protein